MSKYIRDGNGVTEPQHIYENEVCPCVMCGNWRAKQVVDGSFVIGRNLAKTHCNCGDCPIWSPGSEVSWNFRLDKKDIAIVVNRHYHRTRHEQQLDCVLIFVLGREFWVTSAKWLTVI